MADIEFRTFAGIKNTVPAERLEPGDLVQADNIDLDESGRASRRAGQTLMRSDGAHSLWAHGDLCLLVQGGALQQMQPNFNTETLTDGLSDAPMQYLPLNGRVYWSNGTKSGMVDGGVNRSWGLPVPDYPPMATPIAGSLRAGTYQFVMTFQREDGQESGAGVAGCIDLTDDSGIHFDWSHDVPEATAAVLYVTEPNGSTLYRAAVVPTAGSHDHAVSHLSLPLDTQWLDQPPAGQCLAHYRGRIYIAQGPFLYATTALGYELCDLRDYLAIDGHTITMLAPLEAGLLVGTEAGLYFLGGNALSEFVRVPRQQGGVLARSLILRDGQEVTGGAELAGREVALFATTNGICLGLPDGSVSNLTQDRYAFTPNAVAAAGFRNDALLTQYLLFFQP